MKAVILLNTALLDLFQGQVQKRSISVTDTVGVVSSLEGNTTYDFYVSADCGTT